MLVRYTFLGDTQLRGKVGIGDYNTVETNFGTARDWTGGDFHHGGAVGLGDYNLMITDYGSVYGALDPTGTGHVVGLASYDELVDDYGVTYIFYGLPPTI